jgi:hypothetical protein
MKNQTTYIVLGIIALGGIIGYVSYKISNKNSNVVVNTKDDEVLDTTRTLAPVKSNPFTALLGQTFQPITFKPTDYSKSF